MYFAVGIHYNSHLNKQVGHILLDVLSDDHEYPEIIQRPIESQWLKITGNPTLVQVPSMRNTVYLHVSQVISELEATGYLQYNDVRRYNARIPPIMGLSENGSVGILILAFCNKNIIMHKLDPLQANREKKKRMESGVSVKDTGSDKHKVTGDSTFTVYSIDEASADAAYAAIVLAFTSDPAARWSWPRADDYLHNMPLLARAFSEKSFGLGTAYGIDALAGVALWLPPGASSDEEALASLFERTTRASIRQDATVVFEKMANFHPREPHWYLPLIGVDPARQGQRLGDKLMAHALARCDADRLPAYLESSNPRNISFYQRHGFEAMGRIQVGSSPTIVPMLRRPRALR